MKYYFQKIKPMSPLRSLLLFLLFGALCSTKTVKINAPRDGQWSESKAKGCGYTDFNGPIVNLGNFTTYGYTLHDFNEKSRITVHLNNSASFYRLKNARSPLNVMELTYEYFLMNNTLIWNSYREYRSIFQRGLDVNGTEISINVESEPLYIIVIPAVTLKRDGSMKFINYVAASSYSPSDNEGSDISFKTSKNATKLSKTDLTDYDTDLADNDTDSSGNETDSSGNETDSSENESGHNKVNSTKTDRRKFLAQSANDCAEVCVQVTSIDITT